MLEDPMPGYRWGYDLDGGRVLEVSVRGERLIERAMFNKGTAFSMEERDALDLHGLLPPRVVTLAQQVERVRWTYDHQESDLERYLHMMGVLDRNETLFYRMLADHFGALLPIVYTPTVGLACQHFGRIYRRTRGLYLRPEDHGRMDAILGRWRFPNVRVIVVTDGERVLGLGDLGAGGMGIAIGKCSLYVAAAGIHPAHVLPVCLDVGTENTALRGDPLYLGVDRPRLRGPAYDEFVDAFLDAVARRFPAAMVQFEDFASPVAMHLLRRHRDRLCCFNDDIQGTGAVTRAVVVAAQRDTGRCLQDLRVVVAGAGSAGIGIARALAGAEVWVVDDRGLLTPGRPDLGPVQRSVARDEEAAGLADIVRRVRPHVLVGVTGVPGLFTREMIQAMEGPRPLVLPLSNPTSMAECTPGQVREWSGGLAQVATGSPFPATAQCNNAYVFPGVGLGVMIAEASRVTNGMLGAAADALAAVAPPAALLPPLARIRDVSRAVALAVARRALEEGVARVAPDADLEAALAARVWDPTYVPYRAVGPERAS
jgi:malic enzyme